MTRKGDVQPQLIAHAQIYRENITKHKGWIIAIYSKGNKNMMTNSCVSDHLATSTCFSLELHQARFVSSKPIGGAYMVPWTIEG